MFRKQRPGEKKWPQQQRHFYVVAEYESGCGFKHPLKFAYIVTQKPERCEHIIGCRLREEAIKWRDEINARIEAARSFNCYLYFGGWAGNAPRFTQREMSHVLETTGDRH